MHFQIFVPKTRDPWPELHEVGLGHLAANAHQVELQTGPGNVAGRLFSWPTVANPQNNYLPGSEWIPAVASGDLPTGRYLVGIRTDSPPVPGDLERERCASGHFVMLGDGNEWLIPAARGLPSKLKLTVDGSVEIEVREQFRDFWDHSEKWFRWYMKQGRESLGFNDKDLWNFANEAIGINYRMVPELASHLGLIGLDTFQDIVCAAIDGHTLKEVEEDQKKTAEVVTPVT